MLAEIRGGSALGHLGRHEEALRACDHVAFWVFVDQFKRELAGGRWRRILGRGRLALRGLLPRGARAWDDRAEDLWTLDRGQEALDAYERAIQLDPQSPEAWNGRDQVLEGLGRSDEAIESLERAVELDPDAFYFTVLGDALARLGRHEEALAALSQACELDPTDVGTWCRFGDVLRELGRPEEALEASERATGLESRAWLVVAYELAALGREAEAREARVRAKDLEPD